MSTQDSRAVKRIFESIEDSGNYMSGQLREGVTNKMEQLHEENALTEYKRVVDSVLVAGGYIDSKPDNEFEDDGIAAVYDVQVPSKYAIVSVQLEREEDAIEFTGTIDVVYNEDAVDGDASEKFSTFQKFAKTYYEKFSEALISSLGETIPISEAEAAAIPSSIPPPMEPKQLGVPKYDQNAPTIPGFNVRIYKNTSVHADADAIVPVYTTTLPKGMLLFRGMTSTNNRIEALYGYPVAGSPGSYCISPNQNVFFYPYPFMDRLVQLFQYHTIYMLTRDIEVVSLINPSPQTRANRFDKDSSPVPIYQCMNTKICGRQGNHYDPCLRQDFIEQHPDVLGMIAIASMDRQKLNKKASIRELVGKYAATYSDRSSLAPGIPEFVLYPLDGVRPEFTHRPPTDPLKAATYRQHNIYTEYRGFSAPRLQYASFTGEYKAFIDKMFSPGGFVENGRTFRAQVDKTTGFLVDPAFYSGDPANLLPSEDTFTHIMDSFPELRFTRATYPPAAAPGGNRRRSTFRRRRQKV